MPSTSAPIRYGGLQGHGGIATTEDIRNQLCPCAGTLDLLIFKRDVVAIQTCRVRKNNLDTSLEVVLDVELFGFDDVHKLTCAKGDILGVVFLTTASGDGQGQWAARFTPDEKGVQALFSRGSGAQNSTRWASLEGYPAGYTGQDERNRSLITTPGKLKGLVVKCDAPGEGETWVVTIRNPDVGDTIVTCTISDTETSGEDQVHTHPVSVGQNYVIQIVGSAGAVTTTNFWVGCIFEPDTDGEFLIFGGSYSDQVNSATRYNSLSHRALTWDTNELEVEVIFPCTVELKNLAFKLDGTPSAGRSYTYSLRKDRTDPSGTPTVEVSDSETYDIDTVNSLIIGYDERASIKCVPAGSPTVRDAYWGMTGYISPAEPVDSFDQIDGVDLTDIIYIDGDVIAELTHVDGVPLP